ncbi:MAG: chemotaxis protein CheC [Acidaminococcaceae bacterium]|jgi:chemotaxis protein CheC|nr:chemotaxis protein CheC [Acidaminococcaceae bacterium]MCI2109713.1 chemotaxis protein CheC [Acidaminococcaceae bacterium]
MKLFHDNQEINTDATDVLSELGNVGVGKAAKILGDLLGKRVILHTPRVLSLQNNLNLVADIEPERLMVGILMRLTNNLGGMVLILIDVDCVLDMEEKITGVRYTPQQLTEDELALSIVQEMANMMAASYMNAIGEYTGLRIYLTPTMVGVDMAAALLSYPLAEMSMSGENVICIDSCFYAETGKEKAEHHEGRMLILPDEESAHKLIEAMGL